MPACPVCSSTQSKFRFERPQLRIYSCLKCGSEFADPQPSDDVLASIYHENYFLGSDSEEGRANAASLKRATAGIYLDRIQSSLSSHGKRALEIGCGSGEFLLEAAARGFDVTGIEYSESAVRNANARLGQEAVLRGSIETVGLPDNSFDLAAFFDVIEHVREPRVFLEHVHRCLKPGGIAALVTPSLDSWSRQLLGHSWMEYKTEHLVYFRKKSLTALLQDSGFTDVRIGPNHKILTFDYICHHFDRFPVPALTPVIRAARRLTPHGMANRQLKLAASGILALARKRDAQPTP